MEAGNCVHAFIIIQRLLQECLCGIFGAQRRPVMIAVKINVFILMRLQRIPHIRI